MSLPSKDMQKKAGELLEAMENYDTAGVIEVLKNVTSYQAMLLCMIITQPELKEANDVTKSWLRLTISDLADREAAGEDTSVLPRPPDQDERDRKFLEFIKSLESKDLIKEIKAATKRMKTSNRLT